ncbi:MAG: cell division protein FtsZ [Sphingomonadaceae bacterium]|nr:cell division protein FtsZ [Sphingomonadaceae bacterium]
MSISIGLASSDNHTPRITVIGVGGAGGNAIANMIAAQIEGVDFVVANTDAQALNTSPADTRIQLGPEITGGLGAGARPEVGKAAAEETVEAIQNILQGVNMCFIAAGMGGGTGTGAAPVIAEVARAMGVLTVGVVTKPFLFEGTRRMRAAEAGIEELQRHVDTLIVIPNQNLFLVAKAETTFKEAFQLADEVLQQGVRSITDLMVMPGLINLDFADVKSVMEEMGKAMMGTGEGEGPNRALEAAERAIANPLLDGVSMAGAKGVIISIIGGEDMKLLEVDEAANHIRELVDEDANIIWGSAFNSELEGRIRVSVVATGIEPGSGVRDADGDTHSLRLGGNRPPKRPVLELPEDTGFDDDEIEAIEEFPAAEPEPVAAEPMSLAGYDEYGDEYGEEEDDVDGIVDPLAGMRNAAEDEGYGGAQTGELAGDEDGWGDDGAETGAGAAADDDGSEAADQPRRKQPLDLGGGDDSGDDAPAAPEGRQDELLLDADRLAEQDEPVQPQTGRRRGLLAGGDGGGSGGSGGGGSTLFERMANLSRGSGGSSDDDEDDDDKDGGSLSIPRFLGRQNNQ